MTRINTSAPRTALIAAAALMLVTSAASAQSAMPGGRGLDHQPWVATPVPLPAPQVAVTPQVPPTAVPMNVPIRLKLTEGKYDGDGVVDARDYVIWRDTLGTPVEAGIAAQPDAGEAAELKVELKPAYISSYSY